MQSVQYCFTVIGSVLLLGVISACTTTESIIPDRRPDYRQSQRLDALEVPPDLTASTIDDTLVVPELNPTGSAALSDYARERTPGGRITATETVVPDQPGMEIEQEGGQRWLVVDQPPDRLWPLIKEFWISNGLRLQREDPRVGIMETEWAENRADIAEGPIRSVLGKVMDFAYSAPTRDKFRVRLERAPNGTAIYLTHYGLMEAVEGGLGQRQSETTRWQPRPNDPELEAEMLNRLMVYLGASERRAEVQLAKADSSAASRARIIQLEDGQRALVIEEGYSRAWRLVGLALDSSNFVVEDQDRSQGLYVVEYRNLVAASDNEGLLSNLVFWRDEPPPEGIRYRVRLAGQGPQTVVVVHDANGRPDDSANAQAILESITEAVR